MYVKWIIRVAVAMLLFSRPALAAPPCVGDCEGTGEVTVDELVKGVAIALGTAQVGQCISIDGDGNESVTVSELVTAVNNALNGCPDFVGEYFGTVDLNDGQTATMNLDVPTDGEATGSVGIYGTGGPTARSAALFQGSGGADLLYSFFITGTVDLDTGAYSLTGSFVDNNQQTVPIEAHGTLPLRAGANGTFNFVLGSDPFTGVIKQGDGSMPTPTRTHPAGTPTPTFTATPTQAGPTPTSPSIPTPAPGCGGGYSQLAFSNVSGDNNANQPLNSLEVTKGSGNLTFISGANLGVFGGSIAKCPVEEFGVTRLVDWGVTHSGGPIVAGLTFNLSKAFGSSNLNYREGTVGPTLKTWTAASGTLTVDAIAGNRVTFHVSNARMEPGAAYPFGPPAAGSFTLEFSGVVDVTINNS
jgi:hypothetical protein